MAKSGAPGRYVIAQTKSRSYIKLIPRLGLIVCRKAVTIQKIVVNKSQAT